MLPADFPNGFSHVGGSVERSLLFGDGFPRLPVEYEEAACGDGVFVEEALEILCLEGVSGEDSVARLWQRVLAPYLVVHSHRVLRLPSRSFMVDRVFVRILRWAG